MCSIAIGIWACRCRAMGCSAAAGTAHGVGLPEQPWARAPNAKAKKTTNQTKKPLLVVLLPWEASWVSSRPSVCATSLPSPLNLPLCAVTYFTPVGSFLPSLANYSDYSLALALDQ